MPKKFNPLIKKGLDYYEAGSSDGTNATNLSSSRDSTSVTVVSDTGTDATLQAASTTNAGVMTAADKTKLDGIESGAEVNDVDSVNGQTGAVTLDADDIDDTSTVNKFVTAGDITKLGNLSGTNTGDQDLSGYFNKSTDDLDDLTEGVTNKAFTSTEKTKLLGIETGADVTDATNVAAAGAVMESDTSTLNMGFVVDEDDMVSNSATKVPTQQSVKAYVDANVGGGGTGDMLAATYDPQGIDGDAFARANHTGTQTASTISDFDTEVSNNTDVAANTTARHTHSNKTVLDATTASFTTVDETKLDGIEAGAEVNTVDSVAGKTGVITLDSSDVGLGSVTNDAQLKIASNLSDLNNAATARDNIGINQLPIQEWTEFEETDSFDVSEIAGQGVAWDGTYIYVTDGTTVYKYNTSGVLQTSRDVSADGTGDHVGDLTYNPDDGYLYVLTSNYPTTPKKSYCLKLSTALVYQDEFTVSTTNWTGSLAYKNNAFWLCFDDQDVVEQWPTDFSSLTASYDLDGATTGTHAYNGIEWVDDCIYLNLHENSDPNAIRQFYFSGTEFKFIRNITRPNQYCTQGLAWDSTNQRMYFIKRAYTVFSDAVTFALFRNNNHKLADKHGWIPFPTSITRSSWDTATYTAVINCADADQYLGLGDRVKFSQPTNGYIKYGIVHAVSSSTFTLFMGPNYDVDDEGLFEPSYSHEYSPFGFDPANDYFIEMPIDISLTQSSPAQSTWYNLLSVSVAPGKWRFVGDYPLYARGTSTFASALVTLSTGSTTESNPKATGLAVVYAGGTARIYSSTTKEDLMTLASTTTLYVNVSTGDAGIFQIGLRGDLAQGRLVFHSAYV